MPQKEERDSFLFHERDDHDHDIDHDNHEAGELFDGEMEDRIEEYHVALGGPLSPEEYRLYLFRWVVLAVFCSFCITQNIIWISLPVLAQASERFYAVDSGALDFLLILSNIVAGFFVPGTAWALDTLGLRFCSLVGALVVLCAASTRLLSILLFTDPSTHTSSSFGWPLIILSTCFNAIASPLTLAGPSKLSSVWFGPSERPLSSALGITAGSFGAALAFLFGLLVHPVDAASPRQTAADLRLQYLVQCGMSLAVLLCVWLAFPARPETPSSRSSDRDTAELDIRGTLRQLLGNPSFFGVTFIGGSSQGILWAWLPLLGTNLGSLGYALDEIAWLGFTITMAGIVGAWIASAFASCLGTRHKAVVVALFTAAGLSFLVFTVITARIVVLPSGYLIAGIAATLGGFLYSSAEPIFYELGVEIGYPAGEGLVGIIVSTSFGIFQLLIMIVSAFISAHTLNWINTIAALICALGMLLIPVVYRRHQVDTEEKI